MTLVRRVVDRFLRRSGSRVSILNACRHEVPLASALEVEFAQTPPIGPGESDVYDWLSTTQVGGDVVYGKWGQVTNGAGVVVGRSVNNGVLVQVTAKIGTACRGAIEGNDRLQALWVFSSDACG